MFYEDFSILFLCLNDPLLNVKDILYNRNEVLDAFRYATEDDWKKARREFKACVPKKYKDPNGVIRYNRRNKKSVAYHTDGRRYINKSNKDKTVKGLKEKLPANSITYALWSHTKHYHLLKDGHFLYTHKPKRYYRGEVPAQEWPAKAEALAKKFRDTITSNSYVKNNLGEAWILGHGKAFDGKWADAMSADEIKLGYKVLNEGWNAHSNYNRVLRRVTEFPSDRLSGTMNSSGGWKGSLIGIDNYNIMNILCPKDSDGMALYPSYRRYAYYDLIDALISRIGRNYLYTGLVSKDFGKPTTESELDEILGSIQDDYSDYDVYHGSERIDMDIIHGCEFLEDDFEDEYLYPELVKAFKEIKVWGKKLNYRGRIDYKRGPKRDPSAKWSREHTTAWRLRLRRLKWKSIQEINALDHGYKFESGWYKELKLQLLDWGDDPDDTYFEYDYDDDD